MHLAVLALWFFIVTAQLFHVSTGRKVLQRGQEATLFFGDKSRKLH